MGRQRAGHSAYRPDRPAPNALLHVHLHAVRVGVIGRIALVLYSTKVPVRILVFDNNSDPVDLVLCKFVSETWISASAGSRGHHRRRLGHAQLGRTGVPPDAIPRSRVRAMQQAIADHAHQMHYARSDSTTAGGKAAEGGEAAAVGGDEDGFDVTLRAVHAQSLVEQTPTAACPTAKVESIGGEMEQLQGGYAQVKGYHCARGRRGPERIARSLSPPPRRPAVALCAAPLRAQTRRRRAHRASALRKTWRS